MKLIWILKGYYKPFSVPYEFHKFRCFLQQVSQQVSHEFHKFRVYTQRLVCSERPCTKSSETFKGDHGTDVSAYAWLSRCSTLYVSFIDVSSLVLLYEVFPKYSGQQYPHTGVSLLGKMCRFWIRTLSEIREARVGQKDPDICEHSNG